MRLAGNACLASQSEVPSREPYEIAFGQDTDQLILLEPSDNADFAMRIFNADGGEVEACGNATRAVALLHGRAARITTAAGICAVLDLLAGGKLPNRGFVRQEEVKLDDFLANRFGRHYLGDDAPVRVAKGAA